MVKKSISQFLKKPFGEGKKQKEFKLPTQLLQKVRGLIEERRPMPKSIIEVPNTFKSPERAIRSSLHYSHPGLRSTGRPNIIKAKKVFFQ